MRERERANVGQHGVNFINVIRAHFSYKILPPKITKLCFGFEVLEPKILFEKRTGITLMKLTQEDKRKLVSL